MEPPPSDPTSYLHRFRLHTPSQSRINDPIPTSDIYIIAGLSISTRISLDIMYRFYTAVMLDERDFSIPCNGFLGICGHLTTVRSRESILEHLCTTYWPRVWESAHTARFKWSHLYLIEWISVSVSGLLKRRPPMAGSPSESRSRILPSVCGLGIVKMFFSHEEPEFVKDTPALVRALLLGIAHDSQITQKEMCIK